MISHSPRTTDSLRPKVTGVISPRKPLPWLIVMGVSLVIAIGAAGYFYFQYQKSSEVADKKETEELVREIGKFMILPEGETPTLATVTDKEKLADQPFFQRAENGDKVLIFSQSGRALLYRPSQKKIVDMTTVNVNAATGGEAAQESGQPLIVRIGLLNGSSEANATSIIENQLKALLPHSVVVTKEDAETTYTDTLVVAVNPDAAQAAAEIANSLGATAEEALPDGETAPSDADVVIIIGQSSQE